LPHAPSDVWQVKDPDAGDAAYDQRRSAALRPRPSAGFGSGAGTATRVGGGPAGLRCDGHPLR